MKKKNKIIFLMVFVVVLFSTFANARLQEEVYIINNVPELLEIKDFTFKVDRYDDEYNFSAKVKNNGEQTIEAYAISFIVFDYFNEKTGGLNGISHSAIKSSQETSVAWTDKDYSAWTGLTAFAYVSKMRLTDGTVVRASTEKVAEEISKMLGDQVDAEDIIDQEK